VTAVEPRENRLINKLAQFESNILFENDLGEETTYAEILHLGKRKPLAAVRRKLVFCLSENDVGGIGGYLALLVADAVPLMIAASVSSNQLQSLIDLYKPKYIWLPEARKEEITVAVCLDVFAGYCLLDINGEDIELNDSLSLLMGTSGSTGSPKFVRLSHKNVLSNAQSIAKYLELDATERPITTLPPNYSYGLSIIHSHVLVGATMAVTKKTLFDRSFWDFLKYVKATSLAGVPYHFEMLKKLRFTKMELPNLKTLTQAGGRMEPELAEEFANYCENNAKRIFLMYGQTEATARMSYLPAEKITEKPASIGAAIPGGKFWLETEKGSLISKSNEIGELIYEGPNVSMGYAYGHDDLAKGDERQGILRTGDLAVRDKDGDYYIKGRLKRFLKLFGNRVNLMDIERLLLDEGYVVACAGQDDGLEVYLLGSSESEALKIKKLIVESIKTAMSGVAIYGIATFPYNESGKVQYAELSPGIARLLA
jgi:long-chain acyl-CoA synthetase